MNTHIGEIEIRKHLDVTREPRQLVSGEVIPPENIVTAAEIVAALQELRTRGVRTLLLTVDYMSTHVLACLQVLEALREFQRASGTIVASVPKWAGSGMVPIAVNADLVIVGPDAKFYLHSAWAPEDGESGTIGEGSAACNDWTLRFLLNRTWAPQAELARCLAQTWSPVDRTFHVIEIPARQAVALGFADDVGGPEVARFVAEKVAAGVPVTSRRREILAQRPPPPVEGFFHPAMAQATGAIAADLGTVTAGVLRTTTYAEDVSGNPTTGAKFDSTGTVLKVAPGNLQVGRHLLSTAKRTVASGVCYRSSGLWLTAMNLQNPTIVDRGAGATEGPRFYLHLDFITDPGGYELLVTPAFNMNNGVSAPYMPVALWSGQAGGPNIGLWNGSTWVDMSSTSLKWHVYVHANAAY